ncbi:hypothetical protein SADUNF_Sadunf13G0045900 [Salix dunnii]|uniref:Pentatricopeptide repeat-containing protein n=1 Tax=Salix dunnii TaxID=1413687 RepID=A0A835MKS7_9ROSI|nr:hypothetical protein SADUNF_Sadunf13G0045900 [Salix dunnii]
MGERVTRKIMEMERGYGGDYVLMYNIFAGAGRYEDAERLRKLMNKRNAFKLPGNSSLTSVLTGQTDIFTYISQKPNSCCLMLVQ